MSGAYAARGPTMLAQGYAPVTTIQGLPAMPVGAWVSPPGWKRKWIWTGDIFRYAADPKRPRKSQEAPKLVLAQSAAQELALLSRPGYMLATQMPAEVKDMILDYYGARLTSEQRFICSDRIAARAAPPEVAKKAAPKKRASR